MIMQNLKCNVFFVLALIGLALFPYSFAQADEIPDTEGFSIARLVVAEAVEDHEPVRPGSTFSSKTMKVFCFLEARNIVERTPIVMLWSHEGKESARVDLVLKQGARWRTFSSKNIVGQRGAWRVEIMDTHRKSYGSLDFTVE
nr:DUF2914 domain-containing protein [Desulfobulbaceae bacterium]